MSQLYVLDRAKFIFMDSNFGSIYLVGLSFCFIFYMTLTVLDRAKFIFMDSKFGSIYLVGYLVYLVVCGSDSEINYSLYYLCG